MCFSRWACSAGRYSWSWAESWYIRTCGVGGEGRGTPYLENACTCTQMDRIEFTAGILYLQFRVGLVRSWNKQQESEVSEITKKTVHQLVLHLTAHRQIDQQTRTNHCSCIAPDSPSLNKQHQLLDTSNSTPPSGSVHSHL